MRKHLTTSLVTLTTLMACLGMPTAALATNDPELTHPTGTLLATGTKVLWTNVGNLIFKDANGNTLWDCSRATMTGTVTKNDGSNVEDVIESVSISSTGAGGECTSSAGNFTMDTNIGNGTPWCTRSTSSMVTDEFQLRGNSCSSEARSLTLVTTGTTVGTCKYNRASPLKGTYTTHPTDAIKHIPASTNSEFTKEEGSIFCPSVFRLEVSFTLETDTATADPIYIS